MGTDYVVLFVVLPLLLLFYIAARTIEVLLHELGHAIPALLFTKEEVSIYWGSYAPENLRKVKFRRLTIHYNSIFKLWRAGACKHATVDIDYRRHLVIVLMGPVFSLLLACVAFYIALAINSHGIVKLLLFVLLLSTVIDLKGLIPNRGRSTDTHGRLLYNDGTLISKLLSLKNNYKHVMHLFELYSEGRYMDYADYFESLDLTCVDLDLYRTTIYSYLQIGEFERAKAYSEEYFKKLPASRLTSWDYCNEGIIESQLNNLECALPFYNKALLLDPDNIHALNNRGFTFGVMEQHERAVTDLNKAIAINPNFAYAYSNRGFSKIRLNLIDEGLEDIRYSLDIDDQNPYAYRSLGICQMEQGNFNEALSNFEKAKLLHPDTYQIDQLIHDARYRVDPAL